jgi:hypothetical protein
MRQSADVVVSCYTEYTWAIGSSRKFVFGMVGFKVLCLCLSIDEVPIFDKPEFQLTTKAKSDL